MGRPKKVVVHTALNCGLLDKLCTKHKLHSAAELSRFLCVAPCVVSRIRNGKDEIGPTLMLRVLAGLEWTAKDLRAFMGDEAYEQIVWGRDVDARRFIEMDRDIRWRAQTAVVHALNEAINADGYAILRAGQRSGKAMIGARLAARRGSELVCVFSRTDVDESMFPRGVEIVRNAFPHTDKHLLLDRSKILIILVDAFWLSGAAGYMMHARDHHWPVFAEGSKGPDWDKIPYWQLQATRKFSYNTWDLNPRVSRDSEVMLAAYAENPVTAARDFEAF